VDSDEVDVAQDALNGEAGDLLQHARVISHSRHAVDVVDKGLRNLCGALCHEASLSVDVDRVTLSTPENRWKVYVDSELHTYLRFADARDSAKLGYFTQRHPSSHHLVDFATKRDYMPQPLARLQHVESTLGCANCFISCFWSNRLQDA
jgi:hypothetical protein